MSDTSNPRRSIYVPDELWERITQESLHAGVREGRHVSVSEWLRTLARAEIEYQAQEREG